MKEREKEKIALKEIEKESSSLRVDIRARAREAKEHLPPVIDVHTPPSLELLLAYAHHRCRFFDDTFTCEWHRIMQDEFEWIHPKTKRRIDPWTAYFREWRLNRSFFEALRDPNRLPDARKGRGGPRKADNWIGTPPEKIEEVF